MSDGIERLVVNSDKSLVDCDNKILSMFNEHKHLTISIRAGIDRSILQNSLWGAMYKRIMQTLQWEFKHARAHCKLYHGVPILKRDFEGFSESFSRVFGSMLVNEEAALKLMSPNKLFPNDGFPVTRYFSTKQGCEYTEAIVMGFDQVNFSDLLDN